MSTVSFSRYLDLETFDLVFPGIPNPTPEQREAVADLHQAARDVLPSLTTSADIIGELDAIKETYAYTRPVALTRDVQQIETLRIMNTAILEAWDRDYQYHEDLRRFFQIAEPMIYAAFGLVEDPNTLQEADLIVLALQSWKLLEAETEDFAEQDVGDERDVFDRLRRHWRWLGNQTAAPYEPLYELMTGRPLWNE